MSGLVNAVVLDDYLKQSHFQPWWETLHSLTVMVMAVTALMVEIYWQTDYVSCVPQDYTILSSFGDAEADFVNQSCSVDTGLFVFSVTPWLTIGIVMMTYLAGRYWMYLPSVGKPTLHFSKLCEIKGRQKNVLLYFLSANQSQPFQHRNKEDVDEVVDFVQRIAWVFSDENTLEPPSSSDSDSERIEKALNCANNFTPNNSLILSKHYQRRNVSLFAVAAVNILVHSLYLRDYYHSTSSVCVIEDIHKAYNCLVASQDFMLIAAVSMLILSLIQIILSIFLLVCFRLQPNVDFLIKFAEHSGHKENLLVIKLFLKRTCQFYSARASERFHCSP